MALRIGQVSYINVLPVVYPMEAGWVHVDGSLVRGTPAQLNSWLEEGAIDVGVISAFEYARRYQDLMLLPDISIAAEGAVGSGILVSKYRFDQLDGKTIALTSSSATMANLVRVLARYYYQISPNFITAAPNMEEMLKEADACLLIGDDALAASKRTGDLFVDDVGKAWWILTGLPMVFGVWATPKRIAEKKRDELLKLTDALREAKRLGRDNLDTVVEVAEGIVPLSADEIRDYYKLQLYDFNPQFQKGLLEYYHRCAQMRLIQPVPKLEFLT